MTAAAPITPSIASLGLADPFAWLPPHMQPPARRYGFGLRPGATWAIAHVRGHLWYGDGAAFICSGIPATGARPRCSYELEGLLCMRERAPAGPVTRGAFAEVGSAFIATAYLEMVRELWLPQSWEAGTWSDPVVAYVLNRPVAIVAPMDPTKDG